MITETFRDDALALALTVLAERVCSLPKEDREDLYELSKAFFMLTRKDPKDANDDEELQSIKEAMYEIMEQKTEEVRELDLDDSPSEDLKKWLTFVSEKIRTSRKERGMTQSQLADATGIPQSHISRLENGQHSPSFFTLEKIANALDIPVSQLDPST